MNRTELSGGVLDKATGKVRWTWRAVPGRVRREYIITYTVKYPKNQVVILEN
ncbi:MAG: hypothetical protein R2744_01135 [Bacteroidales bacterium]